MGNVTGAYVVLAVDGSGAPLATQPGGTITVNVSDGTATQGSDYTAAPSIVATVGAQFTIDAIDDALADNGETFQLALGNDWSLEGDFDITNYAGTVTTTIIDEGGNDPENPEDNDSAFTFQLFTADENGNVTVGDSVIYEDGPEPTIAYYVVLAVDGGGVPLGSQPTGTIDVSFTNGTASDADYNPGATPSQTVSVGVAFNSSAIDDALADDGEVFTVGLVGNYSDAAAYEAVTYSDATVVTTIRDEEEQDNAFTLQIFAVVGGEGGPEYVAANTIYEDVELGSITGTYVVLAVDGLGEPLATQPGGDVVVNVSDVTATVGDDYVTATQVTTTVGSTFTIDAIDDVLADSPETFTLALQDDSWTRDSEFEDVTYTGSVTTTILDETSNDSDNPDDNDSAFTFKLFAADSEGNVSESPSEIYEPGAEGPQTAYYVVLAVDEAGVPLVDQPAGTIDVSFTNGTASDADYNPGATASQTVTVGAAFDSTALDDALADDGETFTVGLVGNYSAAATYEAISYSDATVVTTIKDEPEDPDTAFTLKLFAVVQEEYVAANDISEDTGLGAPTTGTYVVLAVDGSGVPLTTQPGGTVTVNVTDGDAIRNTDYTSTAQITATVGTSFEIDAIDDVLADDGETFTLGLENDSWSRDAEFEDVVYTGSVTTTIMDETSNDPENPDDNDSAFTFKLFAADSEGNVSESPSEIYEPGAEGPQTAYYVVLAVDEAGVPLVDQPAGTIDVSFTNGTASDADYNPGATASQTVTVGAAFDSTALDDALADDGEAFTVGLVGNYSAESTYEAISYSDATVVTTIKDEPEDPDTAFTLKLFAVVEGAYVAANTIYENEVVGSKTGTYVVLAVDSNGDPLSPPEAQPAGTVTVKVTGGTATPSSDFTSAAEITATVGTTFTIDAIDDGELEENENFTLALADGSWSRDAEFEEVGYLGAVETTIVDVTGPGGPAEDLVVRAILEDLLVDEIADNESVTGTLQFSEGSTAVSGFAITDISGLSGFTDGDGGTPIYWELSEDGSTVTGYLDAGKTTTALTLTLVPDAPNASVGVVLAIEAPLANLFADDVATNLALGSVEVTATDASGLTATGTAILSAVDDLPEMGEALTSDSRTTIANTAGSITGQFENFSGGADTFADLTISLTDIEGLTFAASEQTGTDPLTELFTAKDAGGDTVFTLEVDETGAYTFTLLKPLPGETQTLDLLGNVVAGGPDGTYVAVLPDGTRILIDGAGTGDVNPSSTGLAINNNNLDPTETLQFALPEPVSTVTFGAKAVNPGSLSLQYWNGSSWESAGSQSLAGDGSVTFDLGGASADQLRLTTESGKFKITFVSYTEAVAADPLPLPFTISGVDADGDTTSTTLDLLIDAEEAPPITPAALATGSATTQDAEAAGAAVDTDSGTLDFSGFTGVSFEYDGGLGAANESSEAGITTFVADDGSWSLTIYESTGAYTFSLNDPYAHASGDDEAQGQVTVTLTGTDSNTANSTLTLTITDTGVTAVADDSSANEPGSAVGKENLVLILDLSGSMDWDEAGNESGDRDFDGTTRLDLAKAAIADLFATGNVNAVYIVTFSTDADSLNGGSWYTDLDAALTAVEALSAGGRTNYDAALEEAINSLDAEIFPEGASATKAIFLTDGEPNEPDNSEGINSTEESDWIDFLVNNGFDDAYAVGFGGIGSGEISELEPIAVDVGAGETAGTYNGGTDAQDDNVIIVAQGESISVGLIETLDPVPATGNVLDNDTGIEGPLSLAEVSYDGQTHDFAVDGATATFTLGDYGEVEISSDGSYSFLVTEDVDSLETAAITYVAQDADSDTASATLTLQAAPRVSVDSIVAGDGRLAEAGETSQSFTVNLQSAPLATQSFALTSAALASGDVTAAVSGTGVSYDSTTGMVTLQAGVTSFVVTLTAVDDVEEEGVELSSLSIGGASADFSIADDDLHVLRDATDANETLTGEDGTVDIFTWELADAPDAPPAEPTTTTFDDLEVADKDTGSSRGPSSGSQDFTVDGEGTLSFEITVDLRDDDDYVSWKLLNESNEVVAGGDYDEDDEDDSPFSIEIADLASGEYELVLEVYGDSNRWSTGEIKDLTLTDDPGNSSAAASHADIVAGFNPEEDVLNFSDLLSDPDAEVSFSEAGGSTTIIITNVTDAGTSQSITLDGVGQAELEAALSPGVNLADLLNSGSYSSSD
ncbi:VWA domain-containing protein [Halieaceae bacterium]|nr:VWA domain-containing protein [Halieaceae bacterium]